MYYFKRRLIYSPKHSRLSLTLTKLLFTGNSKYSMPLKNNAFFFRSTFESNNSDLPPPLQVIELCIIFFHVNDGTSCNYRKSGLLYFFSVQDWTVK